MQPTDQVSGIVPESPGVVRAMFQIPCCAKADLLSPANKISMVQLKSGIDPVSEKTTPPEISIALLGPNLAPSPSNVPEDKCRFTDSSSTSIAAENFHLFSGKL